MEERIAQLEATVSMLIGQLDMKADKMQMVRILERLEDKDSAVTVNDIYSQSAYQGKWDKSKTTNGDIYLRSSGAIKHKGEGKSE
ncbi:hypothetical protein CHH77_02355 [Shouchella clausii]|uniref:hypothetical protein n=1 Tax=Shouchella clausii TaxID=79880 RepID=UPI000BA5EC2F|nr:hypothetical protein [Shouchella clausii]PAE84980.1 hypothetical protein CHH77_02355 [Shouchella clausii]